MIKSECFSVTVSFGKSVLQGSTLNELVGFTWGVQVAVVYHRTEFGAAAAPLTINHINYVSGTQHTLQNGTPLTNTNNELLIISHCNNTILLQISASREMFILQTRCLNSGYAEVLKKRYHFRILDSLLKIIQ